MIFGYLPSAQCQASAYKIIIISLALIDAQYAPVSRITIMSPILVLGSFLILISSGLPGAGVRMSLVSQLWPTTTYSSSSASGKAFNTMTSAVHG